MPSNTTTPLVTPVTPTIPAAPAAPAFASKWPRRQLTVAHMDAKITTYLMAQPNATSTSVAAQLAGLTVQQKAALYQTARNAAIDAALKANPTLVGTKLNIASAFHRVPSTNGGRVSRATTHPNGSAVVAGTAGNGQVIVQWVSTATVHADRIAGLVS